MRINPIALDRLATFINTHATGIAATVGLLCVLLGAVLSIEFHDAYRLVP